MKLTLLIALLTAGQAFTQSADIELFRYPVLISTTQTNQAASNDLKTIRYTRVLRWAPKSEKDLSNYKKTYKRNDLTNNSIISITSDYPSWLINSIANYNKGKKSSELVRVFGKAHSFGGNVFAQKYFSTTKGKWYQQTRKVRKTNGRIGHIAITKSIENSRLALAKGKFSSRSTFAFNPIDFQTDSEHILKINSKSVLKIRKHLTDVSDPFEKSINLAGKEIEFIKSNKNKYKYSLTCNKDYSQYFDGCKESLINHYNTVSNDDPKKIIESYLQAESLKKIEKSCMRCKIEPYFRVKTPSDKISKIYKGSPSHYSKFEFLPSMAFVEKVNASGPYPYPSNTSELINEMFAIDNEFSFLKDLLSSPAQFQTMISRIDKRDIPSINYPENAFGTFGYSRDSRGAKAESRSTLNPYAACMFKKLQKTHLSKILRSHYRALNSKFRGNLISCLAKHHPNVPKAQLENERLIISLFEKSNHPCSSHILNTGMGLQYGDMSIAYTFKTFAPHGTHSQGKCIDVRPMRQTHIDRETFLEKINHQIRNIGNKKLIKDLNSFIRSFSLQNINLRGIRSSTAAIEKMFPDLYVTKKSDNGEVIFTGLIKKYNQLASPIKKLIMSEYINHAIAIHEQGETNPAVIAYFQYSLTAIDSNFDSIKDENTTNDFIGVLREVGADHDTIAYSEGYRTHSRHYHNQRNEKLGLEETKNWKGHNDHIHFCFDYTKVEKDMESLMAAKKSIGTENNYLQQNQLNEYLNKKFPTVGYKDYFEGLSNKMECLKHIPSRFNDTKLKEQINTLSDGVTFSN